MRWSWLLGAVLALGCSSVRATSVRTGSAVLPPYFGEVAIFTTGSPGVGTELGTVEVHAAESEATIEALVPLFVRKAAALGGNVAVIDSVRARFALVSRPQVETYTYACCWRMQCTGTRTSWVNVEVLVVTVEGKALRVDGAPWQGAR